MVCVESDSEDFVGVCRVDCGSIDLDVELCVVLSGVWRGDGDLCFAWVNVEFILCCPCV